MADPFIQTLIQLLTGSPQAAAANVPAQVAPRQPMAMPQEAPMPAPRPATLPQGSFTPAAAPVQTGPEAVQGGPLAQLFGPQMSKFMRTAGAGMANLRGNPYGDPFITAAQGFGGAQEYAGAQEDAARQQAAAAENLAYGRSQGEAKTQREIEKDEADLELRRLADRRAQTTADLANKRTALEIRREARQNGITTSQMLEIERIAQAAGENLYGPDRQQAVDETRSRLLDQVKAGEGISGGAGLSGGNEPTATNPETGEQMIYRNGAWEPL